MPVGLTVTNSIDLTAALKERLEKGVLKSADVKTVVEFVKKNLHTKVQVLEQEVEKSKIEGLKVELVSTAVVEANGESEFARWVGGFVEHGELVG